MVICSTLGTLRQWTISISKINPMDVRFSYSCWE